MIGGIVSGVGNVLGSTIGAVAGYYQQKSEQKFNAEQAQLNRDFQTQEREAAQQFNVDMWNMNNEYNSPAEQVKRLQEAGFSPNALLGGGASPYQSSAVTTNPQIGSLAQFAGGLGPSLVNTGATLGLNTADIINKIADTENKRYELYWNKLTEGKRIEQMDSVTENNWAQIKQCLANAGVADVTREQIAETNKWIAKKNEAELKEMNQKLLVLQAQIKDYEASAKLKSEQSLTEGAQRDLIGSQKNVADAQAESLLESAAYQRLKTQFSLITGIPLEADAFNVAYTLWASGSGNLERYINNFVVPLEHSSWKPADFVVKKEESSKSTGGVNVDAGVFGDYGGTYESQTQSISTEDRNPYQNGKVTVNQQGVTFNQNQANPTTPAKSSAKKGIESMDSREFFSYITKKYPLLEFDSFGYPISPDKAKSKNKEDYKKQYNSAISEYRKWM